MFYLPYIWKFPFPELWRLVTPFLLTGGGFNALWDMYMFWTYATQLELDSPRFSQPGDFATYVGFVATSILVSAFLTPSTSTYLALLPVQKLVSDTIPGVRGRLPLRDILSYHSQYHKKAVCGVGMVVAYLRKLCA